ncbi:uncharacterized protein I303_103246 [Kwoniella dejecticola CBS 10117]|uniref:Uncharacterized protein n=1 Tax=Kwoniella dejecticola CBS 10117 TaxID=1296121 RepID=A0A1A6AB14_9TREE|nr:uncharacterized protein I303_03269 [Kwoniella dejecticola CBS 10117]OBR87244.1 hypothetical protein I303_03269 [Kwoniella dejecticola CBS 10117]
MTPEERQSLRECIIRNLTTATPEIVETWETEWAGGNSRDNRLFSVDRIEKKLRATYSEIAETLLTRGEIPASTYEIGVFGKIDNRRYVAGREAWTATLRFKCFTSNQIQIQDENENADDQVRVGTELQSRWISPVKVELVDDPPERLASIRPNSMHRLEDYEAYYSNIRPKLASTPATPGFSTAAYTHASGIHAGPSTSPSTSTSTLPSPDQAWNRAYDDLERTKDNAQLTNATQALYTACSSYIQRLESIDNPALGLNESILNRLALTMETDACRVLKTSGVLGRTIPLRQSRIPKFTLVGSAIHKQDPYFRFTGTYKGTIPLPDEEELVLNDVPFAYEVSDDTSFPW